MGRIACVRAMIPTELAAEIHAATVLGIPYGVFLTWPQSGRRTAVWWVLSTKGTGDD